MTYLDFPGQPPRVETDAEIIATLLRKGWIARPPKPEHDPETHSVRWDGVTWVVEAITPAPLTVTPLQARIALAQARMLEGIEAAVAAMPATDPVRLAWEYATVFDESSPALLAMCAALGITDAQRRAMFYAASQIKV